MVLYRLVQYRKCWCNVFTKQWNLTDFQNVKFRCMPLCAIWIVDLACFRISYREKERQKNKIKKMRGKHLIISDRRINKLKMWNTEILSNELNQLIFNRYLVVFFNSINFFPKIEKLQRDPKLSKIFCYHRKGWYSKFERRRGACMQTQIKSEKNNDNDKSSPTSKGKMQSGKISRTKTEKRITKTSRNTCIHWQTT